MFTKNYKWAKLTQCTKRARHHSESDIYCSCQPIAQSQTGVMSCGKQYTWFGNDIQVLCTAKTGRALPTCSIATHYVYTHLRIYHRIQGKNSPNGKSQRKHRTSIAYFLNHGRWEEGILEQCVKAEVIRRIYEEAKCTGKPIYCIVDDTISSKTKPLSRALHPIEDAYFHHSHLKK